MLIRNNESIKVVESVFSLLLCRVGYFKILIVVPFLHLPGIAEDFFLAVSKGQGISVRVIYR